MPDRTLSDFYTHAVPDRYRQAASILVLRPVGVCGPDGCGLAYQFLVLHKPRRRDDWQLPQGGMERGEDVTTAALRELKEEASLEGCTVFHVSGRVYQYDFPTAFRRSRPDGIRGQQIRFVAALAPENATVRVDQKEVDGHVWTDIEGMKRFVKRPEYIAEIEALYKEAQEMLRKK